MLIEKIISTISASECMVCKVPGELICAGCWESECPPRRPACFMCNTLTEHGQTCTRCRARTRLSGVTIPYRLDGHVKEAVYQLKYSGHRDVARLLVSRLATNLPRLPIDYISYVPSTGTSQRRRGYNQAELLAKGLVRATKLPLKPTLLRLRHIDQIGLGRTQRFEAVKDNFIVRGNAEGQTILLVDDVLTTGATLSECARVLKEAGAKRVWGMVVAKK